MYSSWWKRLTETVGSLGSYLRIGGGLEPDHSFSVLEWAFPVVVMAIVNCQGQLVGALI